ncbi:Universal stress protein [bacterium HR26]|nr:Universal stress protein [bacterium HR26]
MPLFETIILPLDGSEPSESALPYAAALAELTSAPIVVIHVLEEMRPVFDAHRGEVVWISPEQPRVELEAPELLEEPIGRLRTAGLTVRPVLRLGDPAAEILAEVERWRAPLTVMASHGRGELERLLLGSVADRIVREAPAPVLVVPAASPSEQPARVQFRTLLVPLDGTLFAEHALPAAMALARLARAGLTLVRVVDTHKRLTGGDELEQFEREAEVYLRQKAETLAGPSGRAILWQVLSGEPSQQLRRFITARQPDLVVMVTRGRGGLGRWLLGSVAEDLLTSRAAPLLLLRAQDDTSQQPASEA